MILTTEVTPSSEDARLIISCFVQSDFRGRPARCFTVAFLRRRASDCKSEAEILPGDMAEELPPATERDTEVDVCRLSCRVLLAAESGRVDT